MGELPTGPALARLPYWKRDLFKHYPFCPLLVTAGWSKASMWGAGIQGKRREGFFFCNRPALSLPNSTQNTKLSLSAIYNQWLQSVSNELSCSARSDSIQLIHHLYGYTASSEKFIMSLSEIKLFDLSYPLWKMCMLACYWHALKNTTYYRNYKLFKE